MDVSGLDWKTKQARRRVEHVPILPQQALGTGSQNGLRTDVTDVPVRP
jgi:hypothetical protein